MAGIREFGELIKNARIQQGITGTELASRMGRSHSQVVRWENGVPTNPPDTDIFWEFSDNLGVPPEDLLIALGYLKPGEADVPEPAAIRALRPILEGKDFSDRQVRAIVDTVRGMLEMMEG